ncbi:DUF5702 domain-containing protein [Anaerovorax odorimutans]|uniref:DUF5702 domain-containing protein n=1 Tax=Anaerovorax odorimutans TaxID=109327 RepID=UPI00040D43EE|nr:DUF5702 domain-containing protein [Anaerovorax odorimutans]
MKNYICNKKGSTSIFLTAILLSMIILVGMFIEISSGKAAHSYADGVLRLAGSSILSEYNRNLKKDYGIFAFKGDKETIENKIRMYAEASLNKTDKKGTMDLLRLNLKDINANLTGYSITNMDIFEEKINEYMKYRLIEKAIDDVLTENEEHVSQIKKSKKLTDDKTNESDELKKEIKEKEKNKDNNENEEKIKDGKKKLKKIKSLSESIGETNVNKKGKGSSILKNQKVINRLPSKIIGTSNSGNININFNAILINEYILDTFSNQQNLGNHGEGFFRNEAEYILYGSFNDQINYKKAKAELLAIRTGLNMAYIYVDKTKLNETLTLANSLTPGPWAPVTQFIIISSWAAAEGGNDIRLLEEGKKVPFMKTSESWALDLNQLVKGNTKGKSKQNDKGLDYEGYLKILLTMRDRNKKLIRIMDLIQINMIGKYNKNFFLQDYCIGFEYDAILTKESGIFKQRGKRVTNLEGLCTY